MNGLALAPTPAPKSEPRRTLAVKVITVSQLLTVEQLAFYLQQEVGTVYGHVRRAKSRTDPPQNPIPYRKLGSGNGELRFDFDEIVEWTRRGVE